MPDQTIKHPHNVTSLMRPHHRRALSDNSKSQPQEPLIVILDDLDFSWTFHEIEECIRRWRKGHPEASIAQALRPRLDPEDAQDELTLLLTHLRRQNRIKDRRLTKV